jgi:5-methylcytosine-specific restriction endonuclease McrA
MMWTSGCRVKQALLTTPVPRNPVFTIARFLAPSRISHDSPTKEKLFPYTALTDCRRNDKTMCVSCVYYLDKRMGSSLTTVDEYR